MVSRPTEEGKESKAVTKAMKKVDRQLLSYSPEKARQLLEPVMEEKDPRVDATMGQILVLEKEYEEGVAKLKAASKKSDDPIILLALGDAQAPARKQGRGQLFLQASSRRGRSPCLPQIRPTPTPVSRLGVAQQTARSNTTTPIANLTQAKDQGLRKPPDPLRARA